AIIAPKPLSLAVSISSLTLSGLRCAEATTISLSIPNQFNQFWLSFIIGSSETDPIMIITFINVILNFKEGVIDLQTIIDSVASIAAKVSRAALLEKIFLKIVHE